LYRDEMTKVLDSYCYCLSVILATTERQLHSVMHAQRGPCSFFFLPYQKTGLYDFVGPCNIPLYCRRDTHTHTQTDIEGRSPSSNGGKSLGSIESKENERPSQLAPTCQYKGSCLSRLLVLEVLVEEPYKTEGGGALPRRTHEILTQFYMTFVLSALASPPHS
jgi:hypothetical protein